MVSDMVFPFPNLVEDAFESAVSLNLKDQAKAVGKIVFHAQEAPQDVEYGIVANLCIGWQLVLIILIIDHCQFPFAGVIA